MASTESERLQAQFQAFQEFMARQDRRPGRARRSDEEEAWRARRRSWPTSGVGRRPPWEDYRVRAKLWLATTKAKPRMRGPMLLKSLKNQPFELFKRLVSLAGWNRPAMQRHSWPRWTLQKHPEKIVRNIYCLHWPG